MTIGGRLSDSMNVETPLQKKAFAGKMQGKYPFLSSDTGK